MESYEDKKDQAASDVERLAEEGERVDRRIAETKRDVQAQQGEPGMAGAVPDSDAEDRPEEDEEVGSESGEAGGSESGEAGSEPSGGGSDAGGGGSDGGGGGGG